MTAMSFVTETMSRVSDEYSNEVLRKCRKELCMRVKMVMVLAATVTFPLVGAVRLADPFADGMVLQRD